MLLEKMNYKPELGPILVRPADASILQAVAAAAPVSPTGPAQFGVYFADSKARFFEGLTYLAEQVAAEGIVWVVYPKGSAKTMKSEINRDDILTLANEVGWTPVRQVAVDSELSALRLKRL